MRSTRKVTSACRVFDLLERVLGLLLVVDVEFHQALAGRGEGVEVGGKRDARELALEVGGVAVAVLGVVEDRVNSVEDVPLEIDSSAYRLRSSARGLSEMLSRAFVFESPA